MTNMDFITKNIQNNKNKPNFIGQIKDFFVSLTQTHSGANNFKKEKEELKSFQDIINEERLNRAKLNETADANNLTEIKSADSSWKTRAATYEIKPQTNQEPSVTLKKPEDIAESNSPAETDSMEAGAINSIPEEKKDLVSDIDNLKNKFAQSWEAPRILKTNLVKGENTTFINWHHNLSFLLWASISAIFLILVVYGGLVYWEMSAQRQKMLLDNDIEIARKLIIQEAADVDKIDTFQEKLKYTAWLLNQHIYFSNFFNFLENNLLPEVYLTGGFKGAPDGKYILSVETDNFKTLSKQLLFLKNREDVLSASTNGGTVSKKEGKPGQFLLKFNLNLNLKPDIFLRNITKK